ncbi:lactosylceramide 1,3-N-acetyl-beta-D-glucosaminyltransferase [Lingula anatina]|uniref:Hexosyltransferase n=1 Tax=Lingula anatina TaxID=7574 RepID=A0A1S3HP03_LINAN|nr:lactosylceramide 1,3-N-acetyl-beta-D-glucosaminyltransferase [Lingula anatina]|eukprot:XP_013387760.1 lactosylceramide 1,3-N-acetyl-beta-D-glucosaminyltransferase [Lingula anatina]
MVMHRVKHSTRRARHARRKNCKLTIIAATFVAAVWMIYQTVFNSTMMDKVNRKNIEELPKCNFCIRNFAMRLKSYQDEDYAMADLRNCRPITCVPPEDYYIPSTVPVNMFDFKPLLSPSEPCERAMAAIIIVHTRSESWETRAHWRESNKAFLDSRPDIKLYFIIGRSENSTAWNLTTEEGKVHDDIIAYDFLEQNNTSPSKTAMMLRWFSEHCSNARFLVKVNDGTYYNPQKLLYALEDLPPSMTFAGKMNYHHEVKRNSADEEAVFENLYPYPYWPNYISGQLYIISSDAVTTLWTAAPYVLTVPLEDAWMTILAQGAGVIRNFIPDRFK